MYGLNQAPRSWFGKTDPSLFTLETHIGKIFSNPSHVSELVLQLGKEFATKDLVPLHFFLGIEVMYFEGGIHLNQSKYVAQLLAKTEMTLAKAVATPLAQKHGCIKLSEVL